MALLNVSQAAQVSGKSRTTIYKDIKSGDLSVAKIEDGKQWIDTAELIRAYGELQEPSTPRTVSIDVHDEQNLTPQSEQFYQNQIKRLQEENDKLHDRLSEALHAIQDQTRLLSLPPKKPFSIWRWFKQPAPTPEAQKAAS